MHSNLCRGIQGIETRKVQAWTFCLHVLGGGGLPGVQRDGAHVASLLVYVMHPHLPVPMIPSVDGFVSGAGTYFLLHPSTLYPVLDFHITRARRAYCDTCNNFRLVVGSLFVLFSTVALTRSPEPRKCPRSAPNYCKLYHWHWAPSECEPVSARLWQTCPLPCSKSRMMAGDR
jgi:hypothetical protein